MNLFDAKFLCGTTVSPQTKLYKNAFLDKHILLTSLKKLFLFWTVVNML